jgi:hypothetical protein
LWIDGSDAAVPDKRLCGDYSPQAAIALMRG